MDARIDKVMPAPFVEINAIREDSGVIELRATATSDCFSGCIDAYSTRDDLARAAAALMGLPGAGKDRVEIHFSSRNRGIAAALVFLRSDMVGHCWVSVKMQETEMSAESAIVNVACEPAAIDEFVARLQALAAGRATRARLHGVTAVGLFPPVL
jgi:hypothetical protein